jgi:glutathione S-transferase
MFTNSSRAFSRGGCRSGKTHVVGNALTLADLTLASTLMYVKQADVPLADSPHIQSWLNRITELEAWKQTNP